MAITGFKQAQKSYWQKRFVCLLLLTLFTQTVLAQTDSNTLIKIDFYRLSDNSAQLLLSFDKPPAQPRLQQSQWLVSLELEGVQAAQDLEKQINLSAFASLVKQINLQQTAQSLRLNIITEQDYQVSQSINGKLMELIIKPKQNLSNESNQHLHHGEKKYSGEAISLNFQKIAVRAALDIIADFAEVNIVASDEVSGEVTLNLKQVPWDQALAIVSQSKGLATRYYDNVIWVAPAEQINEFEQQQLVSLSQQRENEPLVSEIIPINYAKAEELLDVIKSVKVIKQGAVAGLATRQGGLRSSFSVVETDKNSLLTARGNVTVDKRTNSILVQDVASKIVELKKIIKQLDKPVRQVMIETRIVEASDNFSRELGARLGFEHYTVDKLPGISREQNAEQLANARRENLFGRAGDVRLDLGANGIAGNVPASYAFQLFKAGSGFAHLIRLELSALEADGRGKVVASPRLLTANQKKAVIKQGEERVFTVAAEDDVAVETKQAVLALEVTPQITPDDHIVMDVRITQDSFIANADINVAAALRKKEIITQVLAKNGETIVIGGIYQQEEALSHLKVPLLGEMPILGRLFKKRSKYRNKIELLIFMTPKILSPKLHLNQSTLQ